MILREDLQVPGPAWYQGPFTSVGEVTPTKPLTLFDLANIQDPSYPNTAIATGTVPYSVQFLGDRVQELYSRVLFIKECVVSALKNPAIKKHPNLIKQGRKVYLHIIKIESIIKSLDKSLKYFKISSYVTKNSHLHFNQ